MVCTLGVRGISQKLATFSLCAGSQGGSGFAQRSNLQQDTFVSLGVEGHQLGHDGTGFSETTTPRGTIT
jgi:hypothetical protein